MLKYFDPSDPLVLAMPGRERKKTHGGAANIQETIDFLNSVKPVGAVKWD